MINFRSNKGYFHLHRGLRKVGGVILCFIILSCIRLVDPLLNKGEDVNYAKFAMELFDYREDIENRSLNIKADYAATGKVLNDAQRFYAVANGISKIDEIEKMNINDMIIPAGYVIPDGLKTALDIKDNDVVAYLIDDSKIPGYDNFENFTSEENEYHFITSEGDIFVIPGLAEKQKDGSIKYYIASNNQHYTVVGDSKQEVSVESSIEKDSINEKDFIDIYGITVDNKEINSSSVYNANLIRK